ncbi:40S ribosomal protein S12 [Trichostrongylus colubriformis]|uniref:40S ribosomal protein S12 n=1 Tax=Trichostrongylus colubriformis TaxID=6319 RepID=A0AAN8F1G5_TRICO
MADAEGDNVKIPSAAALAVMDVQAALKAVLRSANFLLVLPRVFIRQQRLSTRVRPNSVSLLRFVDQPMYVKMVEALSNEHNIPLINVADKKIIGEWCGLCKYDKEGKARKVVGCLCAVVKDNGNEEIGKQVLQQYFDSKK